MTPWHVAGVVASIAVVATVVIASRPSRDAGYLQINTVPAAPLTQTALFLDSTKLDPIRQGSALLRLRVGTLKLQAQGFGGALAPLCDVQVKRDRITTVTVSVLERPPRCQCRFNGQDAATSRTCVS